MEELQRDADKEFHVGNLNAEAAVMFGKFPSENQIAKTPSGFYARAALAIKESRLVEARRNIDSAHHQFSLIAPLHDQALQNSGLNANH